MWKTAAADGGLDLTLSATDALTVVALVAAKSVIMAVLRVEEDDFTLGPAFPELFVATLYRKWPLMPYFNIMFW